VGSLDVQVIHISCQITNTHMIFILNLVYTIMLYMKK
jgi:hypothetical protein